MTRLRYACVAASLALAVALTSAQSVYPTGTTIDPTSNTLITAGARGWMFEVTREGTNAVYRAYRVPYGWIPQLAMAKQERVTPPAPDRVSSSGQNKIITAADCTAERLGTCPYQ